MNGLQRLAYLSADRTSATYWRWLEVVSILIPVTIFLGLYFLMVGYGHGFFHSDFGIFFLVGLIVLFSRLMFNAVGRLQHGAQVLSNKVSVQDTQLRFLHEANLALSHEWVSKEGMQRVVDLGRQFFNAESATLTVVGPLGETEAEYCSPSNSDSCVDAGVIRTVQQGAEPVRLSIVGSALCPEGDEGAFHSMVENRPSGVAYCLGVPLVYNQVLLGSLCFCRDFGDDGYTDQDEELARLFASQAAVAICNSRLSEQIQGMAVLQERDRIAREMHDGMAQVLGYINTQTIGIKKLLDDEKVPVAREELTKMERIARDLYGDVREGILGLRIAAQPDKGLIPVLEEYVEHYRGMSGLEAETRISESVETLDISSTDEIQLLRIIQEALTNIRKHADAKRVSVNLDHFDECLQIRIEDDGKGFNPNDPPSSGGPRFGLHVMEERALSLGGQFSIDKRASGGTRVAVSVPMTNLNARYAEKVTA